MASYKEDLLNDLRSRVGYAAKYLTAAAADSDEAFLVALRDVAKARAGMTSLATAAKVNRVNLYGMSKSGNPGIRNIRAILSALKFKIDVVDEDRKSSARPLQVAIPATAKQNERLGPLLQGIKGTLGSASAPHNYVIARSNDAPPSYDPPNAIVELSEARYLLPIVQPKPSHFTTRP